MFKLIRLIAACGVAVVLAAPVAEARTAGEQRTAAALQLGFYNCYSRGYPIVYQGTAQLGSGGRYGWGYLDTANRRLKSPGWGTYRASGSKVTWAGGPLAKLYGVVKAPSKFEVWVSGEKFASYTCYFKF